MSLKERLQRVAKEIEGGESLTAGQAAEFAHRIGEIIKRHITDPAVLRAIAHDIRCVQIGKRSPKS
jgi:hypothetical protein